MTLKTQPLLSGEVLNVWIYGINSVGAIRSVFIIPSTQTYCWEPLPNLLR